MVNRVKERRTYFGWSQQELADKVKCGASTISEIEKEKHEPRATLCIRLARALDMSVEELFGGEVT